MKPKNKKGHGKAGSGRKSTNRDVAHRVDNVSGSLDHESSKDSKPSLSAAELPSGENVAGRRHQSTSSTFNASAVQPEQGSSRTETVKESAIESKKFSRRKVVSNWGRYERTLSDDEEERHDVPPAATRGTDFIEALNTARSVGREFRFRDELDWDEPLMDSTTSKDSTGPSQFGVLDLHDLAESLLCIPLHKRLDIDKSYFSPQLLAQLETEARIQRSTFDSKRASSKTDRTEFDVERRLEDVVPVTAKSSSSPEDDHDETKFQDDDDELDALLNFVPQSSSAIDLISKVSFVPEIPENKGGNIVIDRSSHVTSTHRAPDLEDWLNSVILD